MCTMAVLVYVDQHTDWPAEWVTQPACWSQKVAKQAVLPNNMWKALHCKFSDFLSLLFAGVSTTDSGDSHRVSQLVRTTSSVSMMNLDSLEEPVVKTNSGRHSMCYYEQNLSRHDELSTIRSSFISMEALLRPWSIRLPSYGTSRMLKICWCTREPHQCTWRWRAICHHIILWDKVNQNRCFKSVATIETVLSRETNRAFFSRSITLAI